jgi:hypothetical protein
LAAIDLATDNSSREQASGGFSLALAAGQALASGDAESASRLEAGCATSIDYSLGLVPVVDGLNDLTQIGYGLLTGRDYTGHEMTWSSYALRTAGVVLALVPVVRYGGVLLKSVSVHGAEIMRLIQSAARDLTLADSLARAASRIAEVFGRAFPRGIQELKSLEDASPVISELGGILEDAVFEGGVRAEKFSKPGGMARATQDFEVFGGQAKQVGTNPSKPVLMKDLPNGQGRVVLRESSSDGRPSLEFQKPGGSYKDLVFRYDK